MTKCTLAACSAKRSARHTNCSRIRSEVRWQSAPYNWRTGACKDAAIQLHFRVRSRSCGGRPHRSWTKLALDHVWRYILRGFHPFLNPHCKSFRQCCQKAVTRSILGKGGCESETHVQRSSKALIMCNFSRRSQQGFENKANLYSNVRTCWFPWMEVWQILESGSMLIFDIPSLPRQRIAPQAYLEDIQMTISGAKRRQDTHFRRLPYH